MTDAEKFESQRIVRMSEAVRMIGLSKSTIYAMTAAGEFPPSTRISKRAVGWPQHVLATYLSRLSKQI